MPAPSAAEAERAAPCRLLDWDSEFFGFPVARVTASRLDDDLAARIDRWCGERAVRCLYFLAEGNDEETEAVALRHSYQAVDARLTLRRGLAEAPAEREAGPVREAKASDIPALREIASGSHHDTRFYRDPGFEQERCDDLYATWIEGGVRDAARRTFVCEAGGRPAGYNLSAPGDQHGVARLELLAVDAGHRRRGLGRALVEAGLSWAASNAHAMETVAREGSPALPLYERAGFALVRRQIWHHKWYRS